MKMKKRNMVLILAAALTACQISACGPAQKVGAEEVTDYQSVKEVKEPEAVQYNDYEKRAKLREEYPLHEESLSSVEEFALKTSAAILKGETGNKNYSPISLYYAMAIAASGAGGTTKQEMMSLLGVQDEARLKELCRTMYNRLYLDNEYTKSKLANSLWLQKTYPFENSFTDMAADSFYASLYQVDFADAGTGKAMGKWISDHTGGKLSPDIVTEQEEVLSIINTIYFCSEWINRFQKENTREGTFHTADGREVPCEYMNQTDGMGSFYAGNGFLKAYLLLKNGKMVFILPDEGVSTDELLGKEETLKEMFGRTELSYGIVNWSLPKFEFKSKMDLNEMVQRLGVKSAFRTDADFRGISKNGAYISKITQQTSIGVDENGVEAAAYTEMALCGAGMVVDHAEMVLDRPFLYGIYSEDGILLFTGICNDVSAGE